MWVQCNMTELNMTPVPASHTGTGGRPENPSWPWPLSSLRSLLGRMHLEEEWRTQTAEKSRESRRRSPAHTCTLQPGASLLSLTGKQLFGGCTQLNLFVNLERQVRLLLSFSADAQSRLQGHALHVVRQIQYLQNINSICCKGEERGGVSKGTGGGDGDGKYNM